MNCHRCTVINRRIIHTLTFDIYMSLKYNILFWNNSFFKKDIEMKMPKIVLHDYFDFPAKTELNVGSNRKQLINWWQIYKYSCEADGWMTKVFESESMFGVIVGMARWMYWCGEMERWMMEEWRVEVDGGQKASASPLKPDILPWGPCGV